MFDNASGFDTGGWKESFFALSVSFYVSGKRRTARESAMFCDSGYVI
jgi:hypothetical protein